MSASSSGISDSGSANLGDPTLSHRRAEIRPETEADGALWQFCVAVYGEAGVEAACLRLQDRLGLDVPMLLFCLWTGCAGPGRLNADRMRTALELARGWGKGVTGPLRAARRALKDESLGGGEARLPLRDAVIQAERRSEAIALSLLERLASREPKGDTGPDTARANLDDYLDAVECRRDPEANHDLETLVAAGCREIEATPSIGDPR